MRGRDHDRGHDEEKKVLPDERRARAHKSGRDPPARRRSRGSPPSLDEEHERRHREHEPQRRLHHLPLFEEKRGVKGDEPLRRATPPRSRTRVDRDA